MIFCWQQKETMHFIRQGDHSGMLPKCLVYFWKKSRKSHEGNHILRHCWGKKITFTFAWKKMKGVHFSPLQEPNPLLQVTAGFCLFGGWRGETGLNCMSTSYSYCKPRDKICSAVSVETSKSYTGIPHLTQGLLSKGSVKKVKNRV